MQPGESGFTPELVRQLTTQAAAAADHAYAPYSKFRVGAALLLQNGALVTGANVENASYGLTICAERSAVVRAVAEHGPEMRVLACAVTNLNQAASPPCGACLQVLSEFMLPASRVIFRGEAGSGESYTLRRGFSPSLQIREVRSQGLGRFTGLLGLVAILVVAWLLSTNRKAIRWRYRSLGPGAAVGVCRAGAAL